MPERTPLSQSLDQTGDRARLTALVIQIVVLFLGEGDDQGSTSSSNYKRT